MGLTELFPQHCQLPNLTDWPKKWPRHTIRPKGDASSKSSKPKSSRLWSHQLLQQNSRRSHLSHATNGTNGTNPTNVTSCALPKKTCMIRLSDCQKTHWDFFGGKEKYGQTCFFTTSANGFFRHLIFFSHKKEFRRQPPHQHFVTFNLSLTYFLSIANSQSMTRLLPRKRQSLVLRDSS